MNDRKLKKEAIIPRMDGILRDIEKLRGYAGNSLSDFKKSDDLFALSQFYLRRSLEGVFHIGEHVLSRLDGGRSSEYKEIARLLGEKGVVEKAFADSRLKAMAGYRNRLTHFYSEITPEEIYSILKTDLDDFKVYLGSIKKLVENPERLGLEVE